MEEIEKLIETKQFWLAYSILDKCEKYVSGEELLEVHKWEEKVSRAWWSYIYYEALIAEAKMYECKNLNLDCAQRLREEALSYGG